MTEKNIIRVGVISDTHDYLDPKIRRLFKGVDHILHAGDIGMPWLLLQLAEIAPVTAVLGNADDSTLDYKETEVVTLGARKFLLHHQVEPHGPEDKIKRRIIRENPDVVVFGHTHKPLCETVGTTLFVNPGYAGKQRFNLPRTVAILNCDPEGITADFLELADPVRR